ncbi:putative papain family cysteine protease domain containing protein [Monocercomonoides exilis]|uniref:putative papain family cysteine protease domain containing protein n=1 Tax=Monocercomonoides exilis TaxID=2049356 RepID=UPI003559F56D|nr:putative papain family cysteine protease domain containing protein [Monocercomonoides exilis]|eukprot:MONOS_11418.1-p1 / transcript=MONOS_11418.1 / gene=MONOS_11418 / organism=Monocercomonoides_exilis_PA203 / gene_product=papain family cysteine protease domain containing protein / transcript_product=papain family cysteine protease domain containing protein / location=Mono_scaffold00572:16201-18326(+) / protein_length=630 / sequence_SO=supercontig / SO=protein_coding / is_pseudo=false
MEKSLKDEDVEVNHTRTKESHIFNILIVFFLVAISIISLPAIILSGLTIKPTATKHIDEPSPRAEVVLPTRYFAPYAPPMTFQDNRGTCWVQALVGELEHSYRKNGIEKGFLKENEYVPFSIQAFGMSIVQECQKEENYYTCKGLQNGPEMNSTSGGEPAWIYYMTNLYDKLYPLSLCKYLPEDEQEWECPNYNETIAKDNNPIRFTIPKMEITYDIPETKELLYMKKEALAFNVDVWTNVFYIPCNANNKDDKSYSAMCGIFEERETCPTYVTKHADNDKCLKMEQPGYNMDGEWYLNTRFVPEGGHSMQIVGYNDWWITENGEKGGFAIKNSWHDQAYDWDPATHQTRGGRGSHSLGYWMGQYSTWDERMICPNAQNPENWLSCTTLQPGPTYSERSNSNNSTQSPSDLITTKLQMAQKRLRRGREGEETLRRMKNTLNLNANANSRKNDGEKDIEHCLNHEEAIKLVKLMRQPIEFECRNKDRYKCDNEKYRYFLDGISYDENGLATASFVTVLKADGKTQGEFVIGEVPPSMVADAMQPIEEQRNILENDADNCGYYWIPYSVLQTSTRGGETWNAHFFDVKWADSSYLANKEKNTQYDYSFLEKSQTTQKEWKFTGPLPHADDKE